MIKCEQMVAFLATRISDLERRIERCSKQPLPDLSGLTILTARLQCYKDVQKEMRYDQQTNGKQGDSEEV